MAEHTPGPWETIDGAEIWPKTGPNAQVEICRVVGPWDSDQQESPSYTKEEVGANGRLIAAAPELLEAVEKLLEIAPNPDRIHGQYDHDLAGILMSASSLVAKAKG